MVGNNVKIGDNACLLGDIKVGHNVEIAQGSVVLQDLPDGSQVSGVPASINSMKDDKKNE